MACQHGRTAPAGRPRNRPKIKAHIRRAVFVRDKFTCQRCGWRPESIPVNYDGRSALRELVGMKVRRKLVGLEIRYIEGPLYRLLELDHIHPYSKGGEQTEANCQALCNNCNAHKGARV